MATRVQPSVKVLGASFSQEANPFTAAVELTPMPMLITNPRLPDNPIIFANEAFQNLTGYEADEIIGKNCRFLQGPGTDPKHVEIIHSALEAEQSVEIDILNYKKSGEPFWNRLHISPVKTENGELHHFVSSQLDVTLELGKLVELEKERETLSIEKQRSSDQLQYIVEVANVGFWTRDYTTGEISCSAEYRRIFGLTPDEPVNYDKIIDMVMLEDRITLIQRSQESFATGKSFRVEYRITNRLGQVRWVETRAKALLGKSPALLGIVIDVTERKKTEADKALVTREISHRFKNSMAMVQSIANQTLRNATDPQTANELFSERLRALSQAHDMLLREDWTGTTISQICETALAPFNSTFGHRIRTSGPELVVSDRVTVSLSLGLYELATNAVKYGALSNENGTVQFSWDVLERQGERKFHMRWVEDGGPAVERPTRRGFGQRLLYSVLTGELRAKCDINFAPDGLVIDVLAPMTADVFPQLDSLSDTQAEIG
ncbi:PAS domain-containing protein [Brucella anthropi]|uniref:Blue-light-activated histidine kinase n=2 Tax=Brucella anthropi TaxID=529 RepID=A0A6L3Z0U4_BRUAN|nr:PAS domain-containing protein [Brucella anthropi]